MCGSSCARRASGQGGAGEPRGAGDPSHSRPGRAGVPCGGASSLSGTSLGREMGGADGLCWPAGCVLLHSVRHLCSPQPPEAQGARSRRVGGPSRWLRAGRDGAHPGPTPQTTHLRLRLPALLPGATTGADRRAPAASRHRRGASFCSRLGANLRRTWGEPGAGAVGAAGGGRASVGAGRAQLSNLALPGDGPRRLAAAGETVQPSAAGAGGAARSHPTDLL